MKFNIVKIASENYNLFDDMVFWRMNDRERPSSKAEVLNSIRKELEDPNLFIYAVEVEGRFVGWISLIYMPKVGKYNGHGYIYIDELWIAPSYRKNGLAYELMKKAEALKFEKLAAGIRLYVNTENETAKKLYEKCGYGTACSAYLMEK